MNEFQRGGIRRPPIPTDAEVNELHSHCYRGLDNLGPDWQTKCIVGQQMYSARMARALGESTAEARAEAENTFASFGLDLDPPQREACELMKARLLRRLYPESEADHEG